MRKFNQKSKQRTSGNSSQSDILSSGNMIVLAPARRAATVFSRSPPILRTLPVTVNSPVMARVGSRGWSRARDNSEVAIVIPALGPAKVNTYTCQSASNSPSLGTAPSGQCRCILAFSKNLFSGKSLDMIDFANE